MSKFIPGPWTAELNYNGMSSLIQADSGIVGMAYRCQDFDANTSEANASLIAAAPELYEALKGARRALSVAIKSNWEGSTDADVAENLVIKKIDAALLKASPDNKGSL